MGCCGSKARGDKYKLDDNPDLNEPGFNNDGGGFGNTGNAGFGNTGFGSGGPAPQSKQPYPWDQPGARPDPKDFTFANLKGETKVREPGSVNGQQFIIDQCEDCDLYILDHNAAITIDDCKRCRIFIGPCESSVFIRDCYDCKCVFLCRQFRTRNCEDCDFSLYCGTRPIIESSKRLRFGCIDFHYEGLADNLKAVQLSKFTNYWSYIHDFTKAPGNWSLLPADVRADDLLKPMPSGIACLPSGGTPKPAPVVLKTWGERDPPSSESCFVLLPPSNDQLSAADKILAHMDNFGGTLVHTNTVKLETDTAKQMVGLAQKEIQGNPSSIVKALGKGKSIGLEFCGAGCLQAVKQALPAGDLICTTNTQAPAMYRYMGIEG